MKKTCDNCRMLYKDRYNDSYFCAKHPLTNNKPTEVCEYHSYSCHNCHSDGDYLYNKKLYCLECLFKELDVEECVSISYYRDGEYLGEDDDIAEVLENLNEDIIML